MSKVKAVSGATAEEFKAYQTMRKNWALRRCSQREKLRLQTEFAKLGFTATEITKVTEATFASGASIGY